MSSVRAGYEELGIDKYYKQHSEDYYNPHYNLIKQLIIEYIHRYKTDINGKILDLCCGGGEVTIILKELGFEDIEGSDLYLCDLYRNNTGKECKHLSFKDIVCGKLRDSKYDTIFCSFAMHLCETSLLNRLLYELSLISESLIIITPHKRPEINSWWVLEDYIKLNKVTLKVYKKIKF